MPSGMGVVAKVPSDNWSMIGNLGATTLIHYSRGSFTLITHLGAWKLLEIAV